MAQNNTSYKGGASRHKAEASGHAGRQPILGEESSSPDPKSGEQWTPFSKVNPLLGGKKIQGA